jgi:hypothetical protein
MNKKITLVISFVFLVLTFILFGITILENNGNNINIFTGGGSIPPTDIELISEIALNVSQSHEYELNVFDCTDFSKELIKRLTAWNYKADCIAGFNDNADYKPHTWVEVELNGEYIQIEATTGEVIISQDKDSTFEGYRIWKRGLCW